MQTFSEARDAINAAESLAVMREQTIAVVWNPDGYAVLPESERKAKRIIERVHPAGDTWDAITDCCDWLQIPEL